MSPETKPRIGEELAGYRIAELAGRGGMGEVYRAYDLRLGRSVALKLLGPRLADDERFRRRFLRESRLAAGLDHPNVIPVFEAGDAEGRLYIAMRFVEGTDLRRVLQEERILKPARALELVAPVAGALDAAHRRGLVHRDVKPANVLVAREAGADPPEHVYLSDFGLTTLSSEPGEAGPFTGTADYAAPELVTGGRVDGRSDLYALGCVLFECLTGQPPFNADSVMAVLWGHVNDPVPAASALNPALAGAIDAVLRRALAKEPAERYGACREFVEAARDALGVTGIEVPVVVRRRWMLAATMLALALAVTATVLALLLTSGAGKPALAGGAVVRIDPASGEVGKPIPIGEGPNAVAAGPRSVWVAAERDGSLWRIDPETETPARVTAVGTPNDLAVYGGRTYVAAEGPAVFSGNVAAYDSSTGVRLDDVQFLACSITAGARGLWAAGCPNIQQLSSSGPLRILATVGIPFWSPRDSAHDRGEISDMTFGEGALWILGDAADRRVWRIDPDRRRVAATFALPFVPAHLAVGLGGVWVTDQLSDAVVRLDPVSGRVVARIPVGRGASGVAVGTDSVWVTGFLSRTVSRIDPARNAVVATVPVGVSPRDVAVGAGGVWVIGDAA